MLRKALGDNAQEPQFIETVPKRGYRFIATVKKVAVGNNMPEDAAQKTAFQATANNFAIRRSPQLPGTLIAVAVAVLFASAVAFSSWYQRGQKVDASVLDAPFSSEKLSTNGKVETAVISPDGKNVVYRNQNGGKQSVWFRQIELANNIEIIPPSEDRYYNFLHGPKRDNSCMFSTLEFQRYSPLSSF